MQGSTTKDRLRAAAVRLCVNQGIAAASVRDITGACGLTPGVLHRHYDGRAALIEDVFASIATPFAETLTADLEAADPASVLETIVRNFCAFFDATPEAFRLLFLVPRGESAGPAARAVDRIARVMGPALRESPFAARNETLAVALVLGQIVQTAAFVSTRHLPPPMASHAPALTAALRAALAADPSAVSVVPDPGTEPAVGDGYADRAIRPPFGQTAPASSRASVRRPRISLSGRAGAPAASRRRLSASRRPRRSRCAGSATDRVCWHCS